MPRNGQGVYTLPAGNPVVPGTLIETTWANPTMSDIAAALTASLPRDGSAPMTGDLRLNGAPPAGANSAVSKSYVDSFMVYATGLPIGAVVSYAGNTAPAGFLECNGQAVNRTTYAGLFIAIGTLYGAGDGVTTFNVPEMRDEFIRGKSASRPVGSKQVASFASHLHAISDPGHNHSISASQAAHDHTITTGGHNHSLSDPGHTHAPMNSRQAGDGGSFGAYASSGANASTVLPSSGTGISIGAVGNLGGSADARQPTVSASATPSTTGVSIGAAGGAETVPQNIALFFYIKALDDSPAIQTITGITSSDPDMIDIVETNPAIPMLDIKSDVPFGIPKLDAGGKIQLAQMPVSGSQFQGYFDASPGLLPVGVFASGDYFTISVGGTLDVYDPVTLVSSSTIVAVGSQLHYITGSLTNPTGWYYVTVSNADFVGKTDATGAAIIPPGTEAQRPPVAVGGYFRFNTDSSQFEGYNGTSWGTVGGGATGAPNNPFIYENDIHVTADYTITTGKNAMSAGPIIVDNGATVTVPAGSTWSIV